MGFHSQIRKLLPYTLFPASTGIEMRQGITFLFVNESPSNLIGEPKYANPTNVVLQYFSYCILYSVPVPTYHEQWEGVTISFTVSCNYTTMNKEAVSRDFYCMQP